VNIMTTEMEQYIKELGRLFDKLCQAIEGLSEQQLNWHPPAPDANSIYVIATHTLGNARAWILGIACEQPIERDRQAEFRASGPDAAPLATAARALLAEMEHSLRALPPASLDEPREPSQQLRGVGAAEPLTGRGAITHVISHAATHLGQIELTRDLALANAGS
jgi:uncharacterized damage-inducible protein DinB